MSKILLINEAKNYGDIQQSIQTTAYQQLIITHIKWVCIRTIILGILIFYFT